MWRLQPTAEYERRHKRLAKKGNRRRDLQAVLDNLDTLVAGLEQGVKPEQAKRQYSFVHSEPGGVLAVDQSGSGPAIRQTRLYVYADEGPQILHVIILGDKNTQSDDVKYCRQFVASLTR